MAEQREQFEKCYPPAPWGKNEAERWIHFNSLKREWEGFQKGWEAALAQAPRQSEQCQHGHDWPKHMHYCFSCLQRGYEFQYRQRAALLDAWPKSSGVPLPPEVAPKEPTAPTKEKPRKGPRWSYLPLLERGIFIECDGGTDCPMYNPSAQRGKHWHEAAREHK